MPRRIGLIIALVLGSFVSTAWAQKKPLPITIQVNTTARSFRIPDDFSGLSFGTVSMKPGEHGYLFDASSRQVLTLFENLGIGNLRLGGTAVDRVPDGYVPEPQDIDALFRFARAAKIKVIYSLRLENGNPEQDAKAARYVWKHDRRLLVNFAIGNEPNVYGNGDPEIKDIPSYVADWKRFAGVISKAVPGAKFGGPDNDTHGTLWASQFARTMQATGTVNAIYIHYYVGGSSSHLTTQQMIDAMLSTAWVKQRYPAEYGATGGPALAMGYPYRFTEANSYWTGKGAGAAGVPGGSNCFATALFALDYMHWWAEHHASGVDFHTAMWKLNGTLYPDADGNFQVYPIGYGIKAFNLGGRGYVEPVMIDNPSEMNVTAYAVGNTHETDVTIINKTHLPAAEAAEAAVTIRLKGAPPSHADFVLLTSGRDGDAAAPTALLGGVKIPNDGPWQGLWQTLPVQEKSSVTVMVPAASAAVVRIQTGGRKGH